MRRATETLKTCLYVVIKARLVNAPMRWVMKPLARFFPAGLIGRIPVAGEIAVDGDGSRSLVLVSDGSDQLASRLFWGGLSSYEPGTVRVFRRLVHDGSIVMDVGANSGLFALLAAAQGPRVHVHAFEPLSRAHDFLVRNIARNGLTNVSAVRAVVTNRSGQVPFYEPQTVMLPSSASLIKGFVREKTEEALLQAVTLDEYAAENHIDRVDLLKIDVEGAEFGVLEGAVGLIRRDRPAIICEVLSGRADVRMEKLLAGEGYRIFRITGGGLVAEKEITGGATEAEWNYLFVPEGRRTEELSGLIAPVVPGTAASGSGGV